MKALEPKLRSQWISFCRYHTHPRGLRSHCWGLSPVQVYHDSVWGGCCSCRQEKQVMMHSLLRPWLQLPKNNRPCEKCSITCTFYYITFFDTHFSVWSSSSSSAEACFPFVRPGENTNEIVTFRDLRTPAPQRRRFVLTSFSWWWREFVCLTLRGVAFGPQVV